MSIDNLIVGYVLIAPFVTTAEDHAAEQILHGRLALEECLRHFAPARLEAPRTLIEDEGVVITAPLVTRMSIQQRLLLCAKAIGIAVHGKRNEEYETDILIAYLRHHGFDCLAEVPEGRL